MVLRYPPTATKCSKRRLVKKNRRGFSVTNNTRDIKGAQIGTLKKGILTNRKVNPLDPSYPLNDRYYDGFTIGEELKKMDEDFELKKQMNKQTRRTDAVTNTFNTVYTRDLPEIKPAKKSQGVITEDLQFNGWSSINNKNEQNVRQIEPLTMKPDKLEHQRIFAEQMAKKLEKKEIKVKRKSDEEIFKENIQTFENNKQAAVAHKKMIEKSKILTDAERFDKLMGN